MEIVHEIALLWLFARSEGLAEDQRDMNALTDPAADMAKS